MTSEAQIAANRRNAKKSTGPRTEQGKAVSSCNAQTHGLFTQRDFVRPGEEQDHVWLCDSLQAELTPLGALEETLAAEIIRASWRLHRCAAAEGQLAERNLQNNPESSEGPSR